MTVQELIDQLQKVENKQAQVKIAIGEFNVFCRNELFPIVNGIDSEGYGNSVYLEPTKD